MPVATNLGRMMTYVERLLLKKLYDHMTIFYFRLSRDLAIPRDKLKKYPLPQ